MEKQHQIEYPSEIAQYLQNTYAALIDGLTHQYDETKHWDMIDEVWNNYSEFQLNQGDITGKFRRESVEYYLGSLPGYSIMVNVETHSGDQKIQLFLNNKIPSFTIKPIVELEPFKNINPLHQDYAQLPVIENIKMEYNS